MNGNSNTGTNGAGDGGWRESDSDTFVDWGGYFVPHRDSQIRIICDLVAPAGNGDGYVELCCGAGHLGEALLRAHPRARLLALDGSATMRRVSRQRLEQFGDRAEVAAFDLADGGWRRLPWAPLAVVSSLAIHHLDGDQKRRLFADMYGALKPGGSLIIADLVEPTTRPSRAVAAWTWDAAVRQQAMAHDGAGDPYRRFVELDWNLYASGEPDPADQPSPLLDQLNWLTEANFVDVDVHWMLGGHAVFSGRKAA
ncbi:MAG: methyltransferase domain-containing protein [Alphaproteobacteria bacterium]|nr:methyltransferase domain-containing protein [Alphaproteobacteria bacterium]MDP6565140.1 methyltransferase domain-containing protein [Alphaproteobacteria bacterium]MDP6815171.1 methyltransferase domain-containing protein [Alphaproteobacteria bacterium]